MKQQTKQIFMTIIMLFGINMHLEQQKNIFE